ncbi:hypothetical protein HCN44_002195 [Aphidius gifuensis]|uniref:Cadherin domain-containing protein n=1 Tax=Aphidius gifuensis TaxID=684658 RepID=A0A834Y2P0_APHGI|nr:hypothetical protein HCN44_002195 [Aphidius gifuensis]
MPSSLKIQHKNTTQVIVSITDINDNKPVFNNCTMYSPTVEESQPIVNGTPVLNSTVVEVAIRITNVKKNLPMWIPSKYEPFHVKENHSVNTIVMTMKASSSKYEPDSPKKEENYDKTMNHAIMVQFIIDTMSFELQSRG